MADSIEQFLIELIQAAGTKILLGRPSFASDSVAWSAVLRALDRLTLHPVLGAALEESSWIDQVPTSTRLVLSERRARSNLIHAALRHELGVVLRTAQESEVESLLLGTVALRHQYGLDILTDSNVIALSARQPRGFVNALGKRGYRSTGARPDSFIELKHQRSPNRIRIHGDVADAAWDRSERMHVFGVLVRKLRREDLVNWLACFARTSESSPEVLLQLRALAPETSEVRALASKSAIENWLAEFPKAPAQRGLGRISKLLSAWARS
jgi:hypothetical protein